MNNSIYISLSAESSSPDAWISEMMNYFRVTLSKITSGSISIHVGSDPNINAEKELREANLIILVFNCFISDDFSRDLRILEFKHQDYINAGKDIFVVVKSKKFSSLVPAFLRKCSLYEFFELNIRTNEVTEYTPFLKGDKENRFWSKVTDIAYDAKTFFETLNDNNSDSNFVIYLAEVSRDQLMNRENLKREFLFSDFMVLPSKPLPTSFNDYRDTASEIIQRANISIHIMGGVYGDSPSGSDYSFPEIQNKVVTELLGQPGRLSQTFYRFVWLPSNLEPYDEKQIQYLKRLKRELTDNIYGEILQCSIEEFKDIIYQKIREIKGFPSQSNVNKDDGKIVFITDNSNNALYRDIENQVRFVNRNLEHFDLSKTGDWSAMQKFNDCLKLADGAIIMNFDKDVLWTLSMLCITLETMVYSGRKIRTKSIVAVSSSKINAKIELSSRFVEFLSFDDNHLKNKLEKYFYQMD